MEFPSKLYKSLTDYVRVTNETEKKQAIKDGYGDVGKIIAVLNGVEEPKVEEPKVEEKLPSLEEQYKNATGKNAINDRGIHKGTKTKLFKKWVKEHGNS